MSVIGSHGFARVNAVPAHQIQGRKYDGQYSDADMKWAQGFTIPDGTHRFLNAHATLVDSFAGYVRKFYTDLVAERFSLIGRDVTGDTEAVKGYEITRPIMFSESQGYCIAHNPDACDEFVCWQFTVHDDAPNDYYWGIYGDEQAAIDGYNARLFVQYN
jgi:hypothetical protein